MLCEAISLSTALGALEKQVAVFESFRISRFDPQTMVGGSFESQMGLRGPPTVIASEDPQFLDPKAIALVDAKALFDGANKKQAQGEDDRSALEIAVIQESLAKLAGRMRWIPHNRNPADGLTKLLSKSHLAPLLDLIRTNILQIEEEEQVLDREKQSECRQRARA